MRGKVPSDIVDEDYCMCIAIKGFHKRVEGFLSGSVPKLELDADISIDLDCLGVVLHPQCDCVFVHEFVG